MSPNRRAAVTGALMLATLMVVLDTTIANVALPHMQAALGATTESVSWVLTSYIVASAITLPLTGWLAERFGRRNVFVLSIIGFTVASALCGIAATLPMMVAARFVQGVLGASILPLSQAVLYDINPPEKHAQAMSIWGMGVMIGPIMGPLVGGYLTETFDWRWVFYINLPFGVIAGVATWLLLSPARAASRRFDIIGYILLAAALGSFQLFLDRGTQLDWFQSSEIWIEAGIMVSALWMLAVHLTAKRDPVIPVPLLRDRNFLAALIFSTVIGGLLVAGSALVAPMLQRLMGYPVVSAGMSMMPRGLGTLVGMVLAGRLSNRVDLRVLLLGGSVLMVVSLWIMTHFDLEMDGRLIVISGVIQGLGFGFITLPLNLLAFATLASRLRTDAAAFYNLMRNIGGSIAISASSALMATNVQISHSDLAGHVTAVSFPFLDVGFAERLGIPGAAVLGFIDLELNRQALMIAYLDDFWLMMWLTVAVAPLILLMRPPRRGAAGPPVMLE